MIVAALAAMLMMTGLSANPDNEVDSAYKLCYVIDGTGLASKPCEVNVEIFGGSYVDVSLDMNSNEARKLCLGMSRIKDKLNLTFGPRWSMRIMSPYSNGQPIATCSL